MEDISSRLKQIIQEHPLSAEFIGVVLGFGLGYGAAAFFAFGTCEEELKEFVEQEAEASEVSISDVKVVSERTFGGEIEYIENRTDGDPYCVDIAGAIEKPGVYCLPEGSRMIDVLEEAGGFKYEDYAYKFISQRLNFSSYIEDEQKIYLPSTEEVLCKYLQVGYSNNAEEKAELGDISSSNSDVVEEMEDLIEDDSSSDNIGNEIEDQECVDINTASREELVELPGIGDSTAEKIIEARPYLAVDGLLDVSGIGDSKYREILPYICEIHQ